MAAPGRRQRETILIVDDEFPFLELLAEHLHAVGFEIHKAQDGQEALQQLKRFTPDLMLCDLQMPKLTGLELVEVLARQDRLPPTVVMSAYGSLEQALQAVRLGASDFLSKPFRLAEAELKVRLALEKAKNDRQKLARAARASSEQLKALTADPATAATAKDHPLTPESESTGLIEPTSRIFYGMVGQSAAMLQLFRQIERVARFGSTVLLSGESGSGKELVARALHLASPRARGPLVAVNCGAIQPHLMESELFGHVRGAFTDAVADRKGLFEEAHNGTLFLDEIADLPLGLQAKLLRVLQDGEVRRVGGNKSMQVDVRVTAASAASLRQRVKEGLFREDLFYRLSVIELTVPPLRDRKDDIPILAQHMVEKTNARIGTAVTGIEPAAMAKLMAAPWPGNVRELQNTLEQACVLAEGPMITPDLIALDRDSPRPAVAQTPGRLPIVTATYSIPDAVEATERALIVAALEKTGGNRTHAADLLSISPRNLQYKIKQYQIDSPAPVGRPRQSQH